MGIEEECTATRLVKYSSMGCVLSRCRKSENDITLPYCLDSVDADDNIKLKSYRRQHYYYEHTNEADEQKDTQDDEILVEALVTGAMVVDNNTNSNNTDNNNNNNNNDNNIASLLSHLPSVDIKSLDDSMLPCTGSQSTCSDYEILCQNNANESYENEAYDHENEAVHENEGSVQVIEITDDDNKDNEINDNGNHENEVTDDLGNDEDCPPPPPSDDITFDEVTEDGWEVEVVTGTLNVVPTANDDDNDDDDNNDDNDDDEDDDDVEVVVSIHRPDEEMTSYQV